MTENLSQDIEDQLDETSLPELAYPLAGSPFVPVAADWYINDGSLKVHLQFQGINVSKAMLIAFKLTLLWYAENHSLSHLKNVFYHTNMLLDFLAKPNRSVNEISATDILNYKAKNGKKREWYIGVLSGFLKKWHELGLQGVADDVPKLFEQLRLKGNEKGTATATLDPLRGPLTVIEVEGLQLGLNDAYRNGRVGIVEYVLCWLFMVFGQRPKQYAALKVCDFQCGHQKDGTAQYILKIPRAKQPNGGIREKFKSRLLAPELGKLVAKYALSVKKDFEGKIPNPELAPLFPSSENLGVEGFEFHSLARSIGNTLVVTLKRLGVKSERTGEEIHINATRFRRTVGTRAAEEGHGVMVIAELLDHSDTQNAGVYVSGTTAMAERIDRAMAMHLAPLAHAFSGKVIADGSKASRVFDPQSIIRAPELTQSLDAMSSCGKNGYCGFAKPLGCYTCEVFEPWLDGPHEVILEHLLSERERLMPIDSRIATIHDRTILAVAEVVQLCQAIRNKEEIDE